MNKEFNITGVCFPDIHYMMDNSLKIQHIMTLIKKGKYFTINRPRQYGKTTTLFNLEREILEKSDYLSIRLSFEDATGYQTEEAFAKMFWDKIVTYLNFQYNELYPFSMDLSIFIVNFKTLSTAITKLTEQASKKLVLLIDEVDASINHTIFIRFLSMLRSKYLERFVPYQATFHSVILAGVHDIKSLQFKLNPKENAAYNSPWNIAIDFEVDMSFNAEEIAPMLQEYAKETHTIIDIPSIAEKLHYYTAGYPFLVSKLCKIIAEKIIDQSTNREWTINEVEKAVRLTLNENNTNFDNIIKYLELHEDLYKLTYRILINGDNIPFNQHNPTIHKGIQYGIFKKNGTIQIHNRIYQALIYNYMISKTLTQREEDYHYGSNFQKSDGGLDIKAILIKFQQFMKAEYSQKDAQFLERNGRLVFLSFLNPILNGRGHAFKEVQISEEKRLDVLITYNQHKYIIELKRWYGKKAHQKGLNQLTDYLTEQHLDSGYLLIFEYNKQKSWQQKKIIHQQKNIFAIWV